MIDTYGGDKFRCEKIDSLIKEFINSFDFIFGEQAVFV